MQYRFYDGVSGALLKSVDGAVATTSYTKQTAGGFISPSNKLIVRLYTLKDGTAVDANVVKLDDLKLSCTFPAPKANVNKTVQNITANGPVTNATLGKPGDVLEYCIKATNIGGSDITKPSLGDNIPANTAALPSGYGAGKDIKYTLPSGTVQYLTFAADADAGLLGPTARPHAWS